MSFCEQYGYDMPYPIKHEQSNKTKHISECPKKNL